MMRGPWSLVLLLASTAISHVGANKFPRLEVIPAAATTRPGYALGTVGVVALEAANQTSLVAPTTSSSSTSYPPPTPVTTLTGSVVSTCTVATATASAGSTGYSVAIAGRFHDRKIRRAASRPAGAGAAANAPFPRDASESAATLFPVQNLTWGCPAGTNCNPPKEDGCNVFSNPPPSNYVCAPEYCQDVTQYVVNQWPADTTGYYQLTEGYFNLNPNEFGLTFEVFSNITQTTAASDTGTTVRVRQDDGLDPSQLPSVCLLPCNNAFQEAQLVGKQTDLCEAGSAFRNEYDGCQDCITQFADPTVDTERTYIDEQFAQYFDFCNALSPTGPSTATPTTAPQSEVTSTTSLTTAEQSSGTSLSDIILTSSSSSTLSTSEATTTPTSSEESTTPVSTSSSSVASSVTTTAAATTASSSISSAESTSASLSASSSSFSATALPDTEPTTATISTAVLPSTSGTRTTTAPAAPSSSIVQAGASTTSPLGVLLSIVSGLGFVLLLMV